MQGKARMLSLSPYFSARAFVAVKSLIVVPHREATFMTNVGLPLKEDRSTSVPSILVALKSEMEAMRTAARPLPTRLACGAVKPMQATASLEAQRQQRDRQSG